jgi:hypothetical protein
VVTVPWCSSMWMGPDHVRFPPGRRPSSWGRPAGPIETETTERAYEVAAMMPGLRVPGPDIDVRPIVDDETA